MGDPRSKPDGRHASASAAGGHTLKRVQRRRFVGTFVSLMASLAAFFGFGIVLVSGCDRHAGTQHADYNASARWIDDPA